MPISYEELAKLLPPYLLRSQSYSVVITDLEGKYIFVNELFKKRFSFIAADFIGLAFQCTIYEEDVEKCNQAAAYCIMHPNETVSLVLRKPEKDFLGFYWTSWEFSLFKDQNGQSIGILCIGYDITEKAVIQEYLAYSESKLKAILDSSESGNLLVSPELKILVLNRTIKKFARLFLDKEIEEGEDIKQYLYVLEDKGEGFIKSFQEALAGKRIETEEKFYGLNGQGYDFAVAYYPAYNERGYIFGVAISVIDISKQKQAEQELRKMQSILDALYNSSIDAKILISPNRTIIYFNRVATEVVKEIFGKYPQVGENYLDYILPPLQARVRTELDRILSGEVIQNEQTYNDKWYQFTYFPVYDKESHLVGIAINIRNISALKKAQITLQESERRLEILASNFPDGFISLIDKNLIFLYTGGAMYKDYEFNPLQWIGKPIHQLFPSNICDKITSLLPSILEGHHCTFETIFLAKTFLNTIQPITDEEGKVESFVLASIDITERKNKEEQINERNRVLEEIAWIQSHGVRQPVANILGLLELIKMENQYGSENIKLYFDHLEKAAKSLDQIIYQIVGKANNINSPWF